MYLKCEGQNKNVRRCDTPRTIWQAQSWDWPLGNFREYGRYSAVALFHWCKAIIKGRSKHFVAVSVRQNRERKKTEIEWGWVSERDRERDGEGGAHGRPPCMGELGSSSAAHRGTQTEQPWLCLSSPSGGDSGRQQGGHAVVLAWRRSNGVVTLTTQQLQQGEQPPEPISS